jgi:hypothetical protein
VAKRDTCFNTSSISSASYNQHIPYVHCPTTEAKFPRLRSWLTHRTKGNHFSSPYVSHPLTPLPGHPEELIRLFSAKVFSPSRDSTYGRQSYK